MRSWWVMIVIFSLAVLAGKYSLITLFIGLSYLGFNEFHRNRMQTSAKLLVKRSAYLAYCLIALQYTWIMLDYFFLYQYFIPCTLLILLGLNSILVSTFPLLDYQQFKHFSCAVLINGYALSHVVLFAFHHPYQHSHQLPNNTLVEHALQPYSISLVLYLVFLTQSNDISQYIWGKSIGKRAVFPKISPNKTYVGLFGGIGTTLLLSMLIAPWLTPFSWHWALLSGLLISLSGFTGDILLSSFKRQFSIKDFSQFIPGHGGVLDRLDSLVVTAPLFFYFVYAVYPSHR